MKVKIIKCSKPSYWYAKEIGNIFEVKQDTYFNDKYVVKKRKNLLIGKYDCQVIEYCNTPTPWTLAPEDEPKQKNMKKKVCIKVENEREFNALMKYYGEVKGWAPWNDSYTCENFPYKWMSGQNANYVGFCDKFCAYSGDIGYTIIPFAHLAAIEGIEVEPEPVFIGFTDCSATIHPTRVDIKGRDLNSLYFDEVERLYKAVKDYQSKL